MRDIVSEAYKALRASTFDVQDAVRELEMLDGDIRSGSYTDEHVRGVLKPKEAELKKGIEAARAKALDGVREIVDSYANERRASLVLDPSQLTDDYKLLTAGIPLNDRDLIAILDRSGDNVTMTQLAHRYAQENKVELPQEYVFMGEQEVAGDIAAAEGVLNVAKAYVEHHMTESDLRGLKTLDKFFQTESDEGVE